jgi:hypothetical protein
MLVVELQEIEVEVAEEEEGGLEEVVALERVEEVSFNLTESPWNPMTRMILR